MVLDLLPKPVVIIRQAEPKAWSVMGMSGGQKIGPHSFLRFGHQSGCDLNSSQLFEGKEENMKKTPIFFPRLFFPRLLFRTLRRSKLGEHRMAV